MEVQGWLARESSEDVERWRLVHKYRTDARCGGMPDAFYERMLCGHPRCYEGIRITEKDRYLTLEFCGKHHIVAMISCL